MLLPYTKITRPFDDSMEQTLMMTSSPLSTSCTGSAACFARSLCVSVVAAVELAPPMTSRTVQEYIAFYRYCRRARNRRWCVRWECMDMYGHQWRVRIERKTAPLQTDSGVVSGGPSSAGSRVV